MGQTKPVRVFQLIAENTVESRVLDIRTFLPFYPIKLQKKDEQRSWQVEKRKDELVAKAFEKTGGGGGKSMKQARYEDLKELLGI
jgi:SWI/SNF-related matrix-associated actin-dependent regulator of chromatin subfamily A3